MRRDELYEGPRAEFVARRDALARELRAAGEADAAAEVKRLRKPSAGAAAVNQLVRHDPHRVEALLSLAEEVRDAQRGAMVGTADAHDLRAASRRLREAVDEATDRAVARATELEGSAPGAAVRDRIAATLLAAATDPAHHQRLRGGELDADLDPATIGEVGELPEPPPQRENLRRLEDARRTEADAVRRAAAARSRAEELARVAEDAAQRAQRAASEADEAERDADAARKATAELES